MTTTVEVIQYLRSNGRKVLQTTVLEGDFQNDYEDMKKHNCHFEAEVLRTGEVSLTIWDQKKEKDIDMLLASNTPEIQEALTDMLKKKNWLRKETDHES
jgi:hypothetical protein